MSSDSLLTHSQPINPFLKHAPPSTHSTDTTRNIVIGAFTVLEMCSFVTSFVFFLPTFLGVCFDEPVLLGLTAGSVVVLCLPLACKGALCNNTPYYMAVCYSLRGAGTWISTAMAATTIAAFIMYAATC